MKGIVKALSVLALAPLIMGGGGINPPPPGFKITGPAVSATIVVDPHINGDKAGQGAIRLQKGTLHSGAVFTVTEATRQQLFTLGCVAERTDLRFVNGKLTNFIPAAVVNALFVDLGITVTGENEPVITDVDAPVCTADPENTGAGPGDPGTLSFQAVIQFIVPQTRK